MHGFYSLSLSRCVYLVYLRIWFVSIKIGHCACTHTLTPTHIQVHTIFHCHNPFGTNWERLFSRERRKKLWFRLFVGVWLFSKNSYINTLKILTFAENEKFDFGFARVCVSKCNVFYSFHSNRILNLKLLFVYLFQLKCYVALA